MSNKRRILLVSSLIIVLAFTAWLILSQPGEPVYQGKFLSDWCEQYAANSFHSSDQELQNQARAAIQTIGTNAIPTLLRMLKARDSSFKLKLIQLSQKQHVINIKWKTVAMRHFEAMSGFTALGPGAKSAVPALVEIYNQLPPYGYFIVLGPRAKPGVLNPYRYDIVELLASMGPAADDAVPQLSQDTTNTTFSIRVNAVWALGEIHAQPGLAVPALTRALRDRDEYVRGNSAHSLGAFGPAAQSAAPELVNALADPSLYVRDEAAHALNQINHTGGASKPAADPFAFQGFQ